MSTPYLTPQNHIKKISEWKSILAPFEKQQKGLEFKTAALLVIDMQDYFLNENSHANTAPGIVVENNIKQLIQKFRELNRPVIFTYFSIKPGEPDPLGNWWHNQSITQDEISSKLDLLPTDLVLRKNTYSTFNAPEAQKLHNILNETNTTQVVISGVLTNLCCETTAREAFQENLDVFLAMDATATRSEELHLASLKNLAYGFATIKDTNSIING